MTPFICRGRSDIDNIIIYKGRRGDNTPLQPDHYHGFYEIFCLLSGKCRFLLRDQVHELEKGDLVFIAPGEVHYSRYYPGINCEMVDILFKKSFLYKDVVGNAPSFMGSIPSLYLEEYFDLLGRMLSETTGLDEYSADFTTCYLQQLLLFLARHSVMHQSEPELINVRDADIQQATRFIYQNFRRPLTLEDVSEVASLSPTYFSKKFKLVTGMGFKEYLNYVRLKHAQTALLTTNNTITNIALECGFNDSNYFKDLFRKVYGRSPREYRKNPDTP